VLDFVTVYFETFSVLHPCRKFQAAS